MERIDLTKSESVIQAMEQSVLGRELLSETFRDPNAGLNGDTTNHPHEKIKKSKMKLKLNINLAERKTNTTNDSANLIAMVVPESPLSYPNSAHSNGPKRFRSICEEEEEKSPDSILLKNDNINMKKKSPLKKLLAGVILSLMSALCFSITTVIVKFATDVRPSMMALFRYVGILVLSFPVVLESKESWFGESNNWWWRLWMLLRGLSGCTCLFFRYSALSLISLADTTIIMLAMPVFVFIFARIFLKEHFGRFHVLALVLSLVGIAFASQINIFFEGSDGGEAVNGTSSFSEMISTTDSSKSESEKKMSSTTAQLIGSLYALGAMVIGSMVYIMVRKMRKTNPSVILFNFGIIAIAEMSLINFIFYDFHLPTSGYSAYLVPILAVFSFYGQLLLTKAIQMEEAGIVSVVRVSGEAFFAFVFQIAIFHELPNMFTIVGAILVLSAVFLIAFRKYIIALADDEPLKKRFRFLTK